MWRLLVPGDIFSSDQKGPPPRRMTARLQEFALSATLRASAQVLAAETETLDQRAVTLDVDVLQVTQQAATLSNQEQQTTT